MAYQRLAEHYARISHLEHARSMLMWDEAVMMTPGGGESRAEALSTLGVTIHREATDPRLGQWLEKASARSLDATQRANVREMRRAYVRATAVPSSLVAALSLASSRCEQAWRSQRPTSDWSAHRPLLEEVFRLTGERASVLAEALGTSRYDALLHDYEPGMLAADFEPVFAQLAQRLPSLLQRVQERQAGEEVHSPKGPFAVSAQRELGLSLMGSVGFDFQRGRLDISHHPFCGGVPDDVRITTRYDEADFSSALMGVLHETGHAKYEQGLPAALRTQPVGRARSMSVHESQSLLTEMQVCRGRAFLAFAAPHVRKAFVEQATAQPEAFSEENLVRLGTRVKPGFIRVDADEVTYPLHVVLRTRLERAILDGELTVADLPDAWDQGMRELLGLSTGSNHRDGCMQDVHWPSGAVGYFPSYTLGALLAAQLFAACQEALPSLDADIQRGDLSALDAWLRERVWQVGSLYETHELVERATGSGLRVEPLIEHLERRYLPRTEPSPAA